jgi:uncharacterized protein YlzI (FlbEa/FlbD family)
MKFFVALGDIEVSASEVEALSPDTIAATQTTPRTYVYMKSGTRHVVNLDINEVKQRLGLRV